MQKQTASLRKVEQKFRVSEIFGPTIQGEGTMIGEKTHFIRLGGCDYRCSWCDSMYAVDPEQVAQLPQLTVDEMIEQLLDMPDSPWVTLSGGNPALFDLYYLVAQLHRCGFKVAVETQGTVWKEWLRMCEVVTVSPKPPSAGNITHDFTVEKFIRQMERGTGRYRLVLKIVVFNDQDYEYAKDIFTLFPGYERWVQVGNRDVTPNETPLDDAYHRLGLLDSLRWLVEKVCADESYGMRNVRVTPQLHTLIWGNTRAV